MIKKADDSKPCFCCDLCGEEHGLENLKNYKIKGKTRKVCEECVSAIKGIT